MFLLLTGISFEISLHDQCAHSCSLTFRVRKNGRYSRNASVRNPRFTSIQNEIVPFLLKCCAKGCGVAARGWLREPKAHDLLPPGRWRKVVLLLLFVRPLLDGYLS